MFSTEGMEDEGDDEEAKGEDEEEEENKDDSAEDEVEDDDEVNTNDEVEEKGEVVIDVGEGICLPEVDGSCVKEVDFCKVACFAGARIGLEEDEDRVEFVIKDFSDREAVDAVELLEKLEIEEVERSNIVLTDNKNATIESQNFNS